MLYNIALYLYADDSSLFLPVSRSEDFRVCHERMQSDLDRMSHWVHTWKLRFKAIKSKEVVFRPSHLVGPKGLPTFQPQQ